MTRIIYERLETRRNKHDACISYRHVGHGFGIRTQGHLRSPMLLLVAGTYRAARQTGHQSVTRAPLPYIPSHSRFLHMSLCTRVPSLAVAVTTSKGLNPQQNDYSTALPS